MVGKISIEVTPEFGYVVWVAAAAWLQQQIFALVASSQRVSTKIFYPTLYPRDSEIKKLGLSDDQVDLYLRCQRIHQNNLERMVTFFPTLILAGLYDARSAAIAGVIVIVSRTMYCIGYRMSTSGRNLGIPYHIGELWLVYLCFSFGYSLVYPE
mmetsp:Transcript_34091/g.53160  ORF Transcript_34091/g.53160 Transcript_34091/m.53160 type:complete len:154 (-) Transcript_34091:178-639(-)